LDGPVADHSAGDLPEVESAFVGVVLCDVLFFFAREVELLVDEGGEGWGVVEVAVDQGALAGVCNQHRPTLAAEN
jgi:hypothetical protein